MKPVRLASVVLVMALFVTACRGPTPEDRDNRRLLEQILTAITLKNARLLEEAAKRATARHDAGQLGDEDYRQITAFIDKARGGDWSGAGIDAYAFRKRRPFVKPGQ